MKFSIRSIRRRRALRSGVVDIGHDLARQGKWIAWVNQETGQGRRLRLYVAWRPLAILAATMMLAGYLAAAVALAWWLDRRPYNLVKFPDVALPWRWADMNELRGEGFAQHGMAELAAGKVQRGIFFLQRGLSLKPDNEEARMAIGRLYAAGNYYDGVRRILEPQLEIRFSREVAELLLEQAQKADDIAFVMETGDALRASLKSGSEEALWLAERQVMILLASRQLADALAIIREVGVDNFRAKNIAVQVLIGVGEMDEALAIAQGVAPAMAGMEPRGLMLEALVRGAQNDEARTLELLEQIKQGGAVSRGPWLFGIGVLATSNMDAAVQRWIGDYLTRFAAQPGAVNGLITHLINTGNLSALRYAMQRSAEWTKLGPNQRVPFALLLIHAGEWNVLMKEFADVLGPAGGDDPLRPWLEATVAAVQTDNPPDMLAAYLIRGRLQFGFYRAMAHGFAEDERWDLVRLVTEAGLRTYRHSATLQDLDERAKEALADVDEDTRAADAIVAAAGTQYTEEDVPRLRLELRRAVEAGNWSEVEAVVLQIRRQRPSWLSQIRPTLDWAEAHVAAANGEYDRLLLLAPAVLRRDPEMASWLTDQAETAAVTGYPSSAIRLLEAVLAEQKFYHRARGILKELTAVPETATQPESEPQR